MSVKRTPKSLNNRTHAIPSDAVFLEFERSDGQSSHWPRNTTQEVDEEGQVNFMRPMGDDESTAILWRKTVGGYVAKILGKQGRAASYVWKAFRENPRNNKNHETAVFRPLEEIFNRIIDAAAMTQKKGVYYPAPISYLHVDGNTATWSEKDSYLKPDAHVYLRNGEPNNPEAPNMYNWYNSVFILQFKKQRCNRYQVKKQRFLSPCKYNTELFLFPIEQPANYTMPTS